MDDIETRESSVHENLAAPSAIGTLEIVWLAVITIGLLVIVGVVYKKYWSGSRIQSPPPSSWSDDAEIGGDDDILIADGPDSVEVSCNSSDVESLGSISLEDDALSQPATNKPRRTPHLTDSTIMEI